MSFEGNPLAFYGKNIIDDDHASLMVKLEPETHKPDKLDYLDISDEKLRFLPDQKKSGSWVPVSLACVQR